MVILGQYQGNISTRTYPMNMTCKYHINHDVYIWGFSNMVWVWGGVVVVVVLVVVVVVVVVVVATHPDNNCGIHHQCTTRHT